MDIKWRASFMMRDGAMFHAEFTQSPTESMLEKAARAHVAGSFYCIFSSATSNNGMLMKNGRGIASFVVAREYEE